MLDQRKRFLDHLHEIRRINEGDDSSDSPGYSLNLVRVPVSVIPGDKTRENFGAEVTLTAESVVTEELLVTTFRELVINDLVDQLALPIVKLLDLTWDDQLKIEKSFAEVAELQNCRTLIEDMLKQSNSSVRVIDTGFRRYWFTTGELMEMIQTGGETTPKTLKDKEWPSLLVRHLQDVLGQVERTLHPKSLMTLKSSDPIDQKAFLDLVHTGQLGRDPSSPGPVLEAFDLVRGELLGRYTQTLEVAYSKVALQVPRRATLALSDLRQPADRVACPIFCTRGYESSGWVTLCGCRVEEFPEP